MRLIKAAIRTTDVNFPNIQLLSATKKTSVFFHLRVVSPPDVGLEMGNKETSTQTWNIVGKKKYPPRASG